MLKHAFTALHNECCHLDFFVRLPDGLIYQLSDAANSSLSTIFLSLYIALPSCSRHRYQHAVAIVSTHHSSHRLHSVGNRHRCSPHHALCEVLRHRCSHHMHDSKRGIRYRGLSSVSLFLVYNDVLFFLHSTLLIQNFKRGVRCRVLSSVSLFLVYNDVLFFLALSHSTLLFSRSDHCRLWKGVMRELLEVTLQRHFVLDQKKKEKTKKTRSPFRPSALTEIVQLMYNRSLWPSVMQELTEKFMYKQTECNKKMQEEEAEEEDWVDELSPQARRPTKLPLQARRRRHGKPLRVRFTPY